MSWDYVCNKDGCLVVVVSRWYCSPPPKGMGTKEAYIMARGFEPYEPVQVEVCGADEDLAVKPIGKD